MGQIIEKGSPSQKAQEQRLIQEIGHTTISIITAVIASFLVAIVGHVQTQHMIQTQPMKMVAAEHV